MILNMTLLTKSLIVSLVTAAILIANASLFAHTRAESGEGKDVFKVVVTLFGITNSTKDVFTLVNVEEQTKIKLFNAEDPENEGQDKVSYIMTFLGTEVQDGDPYTVCTMTVKNFKLQCDKGNNSPLNRPEFVDINIGNSGSSKNKDQVEEKE
ncbi:hypothetical protein BH18THE1_BH18THE1_13010 [soil metagenome]